MICLPEERDAIAEQMDLLMENRGMLKHCLDSLLSLSFDLSAVFDIPISRYQHLDRDPLRNAVWRSSALTDPISYIPDPAAFCGCPFDESFTTKYDVTGLFNASLRRIEELIVKRHGHGILEAYGGDIRTFQASAFDGLFYRGDRTYRVTYQDTSMNSKMMNFLSGLYRCCISTLSKGDLDRTLPVPSIIDKEMRRIVSDSAVSELGPSEPDPPKYISSSVSEGCRDGVLVLTSPRDTRPVSDAFREDLSRYSAARPEGKADYVRSLYGNPEFSALGRDQLRYYLYWRSEAESGRYITVDSGYVWIYLCELINSKQDPKEIYSKLEHLAKAYEGSMVRESSSDIVENYDPLISRTCLDYALVKGLNLPDDSIVATNITANLTMGKVLSGLIDAVSVNALKAMCNGSSAMSASIDEDVSFIVSGALRELEGLIPEGIAGCCGLTEETVTIPAFSTLEYYGRDSRG